VNGDAPQFDARVLLLAPTTRDAQVTSELLGRVGLQSFACSHIRELTAEFKRGAGAALITEETLTADGIDELLQAMHEQPAWSEFPVVMLMHGVLKSLDAARVVRSLRNVTLLERPAAMRSVVSAVETAVRGRLRQYQIRDLLESERAARASAEQANRIKDEFVATVSHELRTPLNAILGWAEILRNAGNDPAEIADGLEVIERNARVQAQLIEDLLDMSRIISGKIRLDLQELDPVPVIQAAIESIRPSARARGLEIYTRFDPPSHIMGDPARLQQIFWNLLTNAVKFTHNAGQITVSLYRQDTNLEISVSDNGDGIAPQFLPHVFERFRQADGSTTRRHGGLGLGLSIVKQLVELHSGTVRVDSAGQGRGATFTVTLPLVQARRVRQRTGAADAPPQLKMDQLNLSGLKVLVVDDDTDARGMVKRILSSCKADVSTASSGFEALQVLEDARPDILISDISMPGMDGYELIHRVRALEKDRAKPIPALALTAFARAEDRRRALLAGYQSHLPKPVEPAELVAIIAGLSGRVQAGNCAEDAVR
jgi:signal transduction histidine kinase/CheY-like chemotaxis protein